MHFDKTISCGKSHDVPFHAPVTSFLDGEEARWIVFINMKPFWESDGKVDFLEAADHIVSLLNRYFDAHGEAEEERQIELERIAREVNEALKDLKFMLVPNPVYSPEADRDDPSQKAEVKSFIQGDPEGVSGIYASLVRFLVGK